MITLVRATNSSDFLVSFLDTVHKLTSVHPLSRNKDFLPVLIAGSMFKSHIHYWKGTDSFRQLCHQRMKQSSPRLSTIPTEVLWPRSSLFRPSPVSSRRTNLLFYRGSLADLLFVPTRSLTFVDRLFHCSSSQRVNLIISKYLIFP